MKDYTTLQVIWFLLISLLWLGYFVLEGFDFGVGMLMRVVGRTEAERRAVLHSIGPLWDGNEVWLLVAGGATFAAFPQWYATLFSGFYLALFLILVALIVRNVAFEFWGKGDSKQWRARWEWAIVAGSFVPALLWGVGWANIVHGVPIDAHGEYTGTLFTLLNPYALLGGLATLALFVTHGAIFLSLRTTGDVEQRARAVAARVAHRPRRSSSPSWSGRSSTRTPSRRSPPSAPRARRSSSSPPRHSPDASRPAPSGPPAGSSSSSSSRSSPTSSHT